MILSLVIHTEAFKAFLAKYLQHDGYELLNRIEAGWQSAYLIRKAKTSTDVLFCDLIAFTSVLTFD